MCVAVQLAFARDRTATSQQNLLRCVEIVAKGLYGLCSSPPQSMSCVLFHLLLWHLRLILFEFLRCPCLDGDCVDSIHQRRE